MMRLAALRLMLTPLSLTVAMGTADGQYSMTLDHALDGQASTTHETPVTRVVGLLKEMSADVESEKKEDKQMNKKFGCWCHTNKIALENNIKDNQKKAEDLSREIDGLTAASQGYTATIGQQSGNVNENENSLKEAAVIRENEWHAFQKYSAEMTQAIESVKAAIIVLEKNHGAALPQLAFSFLQKRKQHIHVKKRDDPDMGMESSAVHNLQVFMEDNGMPTGAHATDSFMATPSPPPVQTRFLEKSNVVAAKAVLPAAARFEDWSESDVMTIRRALRATTSFMQSQYGGGYVPEYEAQSGEILGILKQMKERMKQDLADAQKKEDAAEEAYQKMKKAKADEMEVAWKLQQGDEDSKGTTDHELAWAQMDLEEVQGILEKDRKSLAELTKKCGDAAAAYDTRVAERNDELKAISETIDILTADEARDAMNVVYSKAASFLQIVSEDSKHRIVGRKNAAAVLQKASKRSHNPELAFMASRVQLDKFTLVNAEIDKMVKRLKKEQQAQVEKLDWCKAELHQNDMDTAKETDEKKDEEAAIAQLDSKIQELEAAIKEGMANVAAIEKSVEDAKAQRAEEKAQYETMKTNQQLTVRVLQRAIDSLSIFYGIGPALVQARHKKQEPAISIDSAPMQGLDYKPHQGQAGVFALLEKLIAGIQKELKDGETEEDQAAADLMAFQESALQTIQASQQAIAAKTKQVLEAKKTMLEKKAELAGTIQDLKDLAESLVALQDECRYVMDNFDAHQEARQGEIESLQQAKQILSGASVVDQ